MKKSIYLAIFVLLFPMLFTGCSKEEPVILEEIPKEEEKVEPEPEIEEEEIEEEKFYSVFTGEEIEEENLYKRPFLLSIDNIITALPQSGLEEASLYYEVLAEGDITRILGLFQEFTGEKIGPIRSARDYFVDLALDTDAILVHHGASEGGYQAMKNSNLAHIDGMVYDGTVFQRDKTRTGKRKVHSSYVASNRLMEKSEELGFREEINKLPTYTFFDNESDILEGKDAYKVSILYSKNQNANFLYNEDQKNYTRFEYGEEQVDIETNKAIEVENIIIQETNISHIAGDDAGRRKVDIEGSGRGYLIQNGRWEEISWEKSSPNEATKWMNSLGEPIQLNRGKTWISIVSTDIEVNIESQEELETIEK